MHWYLYLVFACLAFLILYGLGRIVTGSRGSWTQSLPPHFAPIDTVGGDGGGDYESSGERRVRAFLERYFEGYSFGKTRPYFLFNSVTGYNLELDCYNDELKVAAEYNGQQHYKFTPYFHNNYEAFRNQQYRDELKRIYCREHGIRLIEVPYTERNIEAFLFRRLEEFFPAK